LPYVEARGRSIRVKWWGGEYKLDADGKPTKTKKYESASGPAPGEKFRDEEEAYNFGLDREYEVRHGKAIPRASAQTGMADYCWLWFDSADLRVRSVKTYRSILKAVIVPYWQRWKVGEVTAVDYDVWKRQVRAQYSENYASGVLSVFKMLMDDAVIKYKLRSESPIIEQRRRGRYVKKKTRRVKRELPITAVHQLATNAYHVWGYTGWTYIWTLAFTGMRPPGEMYGLQRGFASPCWPAADPGRERREDAEERYAKLHVMRVQLYYGDNGPVLAGPKYDSYRSLVMAPFLHQMHSALLASHSSVWMFTSKMGKALLGTSFGRDYWRPIRDGAEEFKPAHKGYARFSRPKLLAVPEMAGQDIYRLRHWHRELLDEPGADIATVAKEARMGHEVAGMEGVYTKVTLSMEERVVEYLQNVWEKDVVAAGLWVAPFPTPLPDDLSGGEFPLFSGLPRVGDL
jgi:hypothetical protein